MFQSSQSRWESAVRILPERRITVTSNPAEVGPQYSLPLTSVLPLYASLMLSTTSCGDIQSGKKVEYPLLANLGIPLTITFAWYTPNASGSVAVPGSILPAVP